MKFVVFGRSSERTLDALSTLMDYCTKHDDTLYIHKFLVEDNPSAYAQYTIFDKSFDFTNIDLAISIGGDGTFIRLSRMIASSNTPIVGINTGRLGFLADVCVDSIEEIIEEFKHKECSIEERTLLNLNYKCDCNFDCNIALNEISILRQDTSSLLLVHLYGDGKKINSYWADGLIIATPTGSTAYSMAAGGPIVAPNSNNLIITPISPHSLTIRPLVISDTTELRIEVEGRSDKYMVAIDSRSECLNIDEKLIIRKAPHTLKVVKHSDYNYYTTLSEKLMWGKDKRG